jgi:REP element-mobilizing transposase RayT
VTHCPDLHHRRSVRLPAYDYRDPGAYFVTICTHQREILFEDRRFLAIAKQVWRHVTERSRHRRGDAFIVMPNHVHGIIWITEPNPVGARHTENAPPTSDCKPHTESSPNALNRRASPLHGSLGSIVGSFKSASARRINELRGTPGDPVWQRNYYERVIRGERELEQIRGYILDNPRKWADDEYSPANARRCA